MREDRFFSATIRIAMAGMTTQPRCSPTPPSGRLPSDSFGVSAGDHCRVADGPPSSLHRPVERSQPARPNPSIFDLYGFGSCSRRATVRSKLQPHFAELALCETAYLLEPFA